MFLRCYCGSLREDSISNMTRGEENRGNVAGDTGVNWAAVSTQMCGGLHWVVRLNYIFDHLHLVICWLSYHHTNTLRSSCDYKCERLSLPQLM